MTDPDTLTFLASRRAGHRADAERALADAETAWNALQVLNERVAAGVAYLNNRPDDLKARKLLSQIKLERGKAEHRWESLYADFVEAEAIYLGSVRECRICGVPEEA